MSTKRKATEQKNRQEDDTVRLALRLPRDEHEKLSKLAAAECRSLNAQMRTMIREHAET